MSYRRLPLEGMHNARELGGWYTPEGMTQYGVFLRADLHDALTEADLAFLKDYGVTMDVDLRGGSELTKRPDALGAEPWCEYVHLPTTEEVAARVADPSRARPRPDFSMAAEYVRIADERKDWVRRVFEAFGRSSGTVLYHCALGKDRTGIITALLLSICGVAEEDIIADYCVTQAYIRSFLEAFLAKLPPEERSRAAAMFATPPENVETLLGHLKEKYGGVREYLRECGVSDELAEKLKNRLLGKK